MASITEHVIKLQELTQKNLDILQALNDSFYTNQNHLLVEVGGGQYAIPSFIALENKLNNLTANFQNLINAPQTGEAFFNFDGNSRAIEVRSYTTTPMSLTLGQISNFNVEQNDIFKDFLTPNPYIHISVTALPNDISQVMVKKIIPLAQELKEIFKEKVKENPSNTWAYKDVYKILSAYVHDVDYVEYDTKMDLPIRKNIGTGTYVIEEIVEDYIDENLVNHLVFKLRSDLDTTQYMSSPKYRLFDETIERDLKVGDQLVSAEGNAKMEIEEIRTNTNTIKVKILNGEFLNLMPSFQNPNQYISSANIIRFYSPIDFDDDKYVKIPLEEDQYIFVAIAALNSRMNVQSSWGTGLVINTYKLTKGDQTFDTYYKDNIRNVGDVLFEISSMLSNTLTKYSKEEFNNFTTFKPVVNVNNLLVTQINKHLNNSTSVQNIRTLYSQKQQYKTQLDEVNGEIASVTNALNTLSFDDTTGYRTAYTEQLTALNIRKNEISTSITKIINDISIAANDSVTPIENAKYRIRGYFDISGNEWENHIKGIRVQYLYKNVDALQSDALTFNNNFTFSNWNEMVHYDREKKPCFQENKYIAQMPELNGVANEISFNQIDIPISQGETVDLRIKLIYDFGEPFVQTTSAWSDVVSIDFPEEYLKDVKILDIITENNNDIETNRFSNIIKEEGIPTHIGDKVVDQDITYFHKPESIASGFYTAERRIIPLKDKLEDLNNTLNQLKDEIYGTNSDNLKITLSVGSSTMSLLPYVNNTLYVESYNLITSNAEAYEGVYAVKEIGDKKVITTVLNLTLQNDSNHEVKLFSLFPGSRDHYINSLNNRKARVDDYYSGETGVWIDGSEGLKLQRGNQYLYFRIKDVNTGTALYFPGDQSVYSDKLSLNPEYVKCPETSDKLNTNGNFMYLYPKLFREYDLCIDSNVAGAYHTIKSNETIIIPIVVEYFITGIESIEAPKSIKKTMSFDILPSLYKDPISYQFTISAKSDLSIQDRLIINNSTPSKSPIKYNAIV